MRAPGTGSALRVPATRTKQANALLRAKPPKGGDAELRDYREFTRHVRRAASAPAGWVLAARSFLVLIDEN
jgi:hypothetical protein